MLAVDRKGRSTTSPVIPCLRALSLLACVTVVKVPLFSTAAAEQASRNRERGTQPPYDIGNRDAYVRPSRLDGKVCLITGGTSGLGADAAVHVAAEGCRTVVAGRREAQGAEVVRLIREAGGEATFVRADVTDEEDCRNMVDVAVRTYGKLDCAFNNAGTSAASREPVHETSSESFRRVLDVNVMGVFLSMKYEIRAMLKNGGGSIVNCASIYGTNGGPGVASYVSSKHAVVGLTKSAAGELGSYGIRVNSVSPGFTKSEMTAPLENIDALVDIIGRLHPGNRWVKPEEVSQGVAWLMSDDSSYTSGIDLEISGGVSHSFIPTSYMANAFAEALEVARLDSSAAEPSNGDEL